MSNGYSTSAFRRSTALYTLGRVLNALVAFFVFVWVARYLPEQHYAYYVAAFAILELGLVIFGFGMEWVTAVHVPTVKLNGSAATLRRFVWSCAGIQAGLLLVGGLAYLALAEALASWLGLEGAANTFRIYALVLVVEGISRVFRDQLLSCLLLQGAAQFSQMARNLLMLVFALSLSTNEAWRTAETLGQIELLASAISLGLALFCLQRELAGNKETGGTQHPPPWRDLMRAGRHAWLSNLANLSWGGQAVILMATRLIGSEATAVLGFTRNLSEQIRRYLPMEFLLGIVRTLLIARFARDNDRHRLGLRAGLMFRANLLCLLPLLVLAIAEGDTLCAALSNNRYAAGHWLLVGWLSVLVFWAHHRLSDLLAHAVSRADLTAGSALRLLPAPFAVALAAHFQAWPVLFLILACAEFCYSAMVLRTLDFYTPNWAALSKLVLAALLVAATLQIPLVDLGGITGLAIQAAFAYALLISLAALLKAWSTEEAALLSPSQGAVAS